MIKEFLYLLVDLVFPGRCVSCEKAVSISGNGLCDSCFNSIDFPAEKCERCSGELRGGVCTLCGSREFYFHRNICVSDFSGVMKKVIENFKFKNRRNLKARIAEAVLENVNFGDIGADIFTSVPVSSSKKWKRGYNHSEEISRTISSRLNVPYRELLFEKRKNSGQKYLGYRERFLNIINRFGVKNSVDIRGNSIVIVDDIFTTGATVNECARILLEAGAKKVFSLTIARTSGKKA